MFLDNVLSAIALFVHQNIAVISVASALVILGLLFGDVEDILLYGLRKGWRSLLSFNVIVGILAADAANGTAAGAAALAFLGALGSGSSYRDASIAAIVAIGTVNTGYLLGADRTKLNVIIAFMRKPAPTPASTAPKRT